MAVLLAPCKPWRKELGPRCEWFSLDIGAPDTSSSLAHAIIVKVLLPILNMRTYLSLIESQGEKQHLDLSGYESCIHLHEIFSFVAFTGHFQTLRYR